MSPFQSMPRPTKTYHAKTYDRIAKSNGFQGQGKTIVITGGASGVGYSMSQAFASAGVKRIAIISRSLGQQETAKKELEASYPSTEIKTYQASITDNARMADILQELGTVDVLVLNAAVAHRRAPAVEITGEEMQEAFKTNVIGPFNLTKAYMSLAFPESGQKTVINVSSAAAQMFGAGRVGYGPSKAAAAQVMQHFAAEQKDNVRIFSFHPGAIYTPGTARNFPNGAGSAMWEDINLPAHFALWLAGPESDFLHGRHVWAQWDVDELIELKEKLAKDANLLKIGLIM
jgi:NAD(P)-dependent dehydrogenase (short-subunit alcohol dehydrogenase family)